jgi:hypothetical protein
MQYFTNSGSPITLATLNGVIAGHGSVLLAYADYLTETAQLTFTSSSSFGALAESSGHIEIRDASGQSIDRVGWGSASQPLTKAAKAPSAGRSLQRMSLPDTSLANTANNYNDFLVSDIPNPHGGGYIADPQVVAPPSPTPTPSPVSTPSSIPVTTPTVSCEGVIISEILPNPAGADAGHEFIELHNPTSEVIDLTGCSLQTGSTSKSTYAFTTTSLQPGEYRSFTDTETNLTLANAAGGTVWLLTATDELQAVAYGAGLADDVSWALVDGAWAQTFTPTPGGGNTLTVSAPCPTGQERNAETNRCQTIDSEGTATATGNASSPVPCKFGQERNPDTNRCRNITATDASLTACKPGQTRNPATNRCATATATSSSTPTACKAGQERNPDTNRCKAIATTDTAAKACPAGQERNPDTGRCRKSTAAGGNIAKVQDVKTPLSASHGKWLLIIVAILVAIGYAVFEWRQEISQKFSQLISRNDKQLRPVRA